MIWLWVAFVALILILLALDLGIFHRNAHAVTIKEALAWTAVWTALAMGFAVFVYFLYERRWFGTQPDVAPGGEAAILFLSGYLLEESLSLDNVFVIALILDYFRVPATSRHRVLFWGILGALVMRGAMIGGGVALVSRFHWVLYVLGAFLIVSAFRLILSRSEAQPQNNILVRTARRLLPISDQTDSEHFLTRANGAWALTPMAMALVTVEGADAAFAVDSIPAIFAITEIPFIIFTSNVFAILGLRSLYFAVAGLLGKFRYLKLSLAILLALIGTKMILRDFLHAVPGLTYWTLGAIVVILGSGILASILNPARVGRPEENH